MLNLYFFICNNRAAECVTTYLENNFFNLTTVQFLLQLLNIWLLLRETFFFIIITVAHAPIYTYATLADRLDVIEALIDQGLRVLSVGSVLWHPLQSCQGF